jgi:hypothetical protein
LDIEKVIHAVHQPTMGESARVKALPDTTESYTMTVILGEISAA